MTNLPFPMYLRPGPLRLVAFSFVVFIVLCVILYIFITDGHRDECLDENAERYVLEGRDLETAYFLVERSGVCR